MTEELTEKYYAGLYYTINETGTVYSIYEYTPVLKAKHIVGSGSTIENSTFDDKHVRKAIDEILDGSIEKLITGKEPNYIQLKLPLDGVL